MKIRLGWAQLQHCQELVLEHSVKELRRCLGVVQVLVQRNFGSSVELELESALGVVPVFIIHVVVVIHIQYISEHTLFDWLEGTGIGAVRNIKKKSERRLI